ncbi:hypothetical protein GOA87_31910 [Sinorhizobium meliloti]|nr:hypothetical protein [Sinorhizobium meliloti]MDW9695827.1 hypothetical protein [Sinorhizobium meliloti]MDW9720666.1 hypothetical protein [Sinorhizobium meliloti]MDW9757890.1 hypothetical protein [Sinorhizobium meliloti]
MPRWLMHIVGAAIGAQVILTIRKSSLVCLLSINSVLLPKQADRYDLARLATSLNKQMMLRRSTSGVGEAE